MSVVVVDELQTVEIDVEHPDDLTGGPGLDQVDLEALAETNRVGLVLLTLSQPTGP